MRVFRALLVVSLGSFAAAQQVRSNPSAPPPAAPAAFVPDPVVHPDRSVTFTLKAPGAAGVALALEGAREPIPMVRSGAGEWTLTTAALPPEIYSYHFMVDGQYTLDAHNVSLKAGVLNAGNVFLVPGAMPEPWEETAVPHGEVHREAFTSTVVKGLERGQDEYVVYTPPGYDARGTSKYPVLYLLHGWGDTAGGWTSTGQAGWILDNLIAAGKARPMIVVMPTGYGDMRFVRDGWGVWQDADAIDHNLQLFTRSLLTEVMPRVEREYNISSKREDRAVAGLSMGGLEALTVGLNHTGLFAYVGGFSSAVHLLKPEGLAALDAKTANLKLLWLSCGTEDGLIDPNRRLAATLKGEGLPLTQVETPGMHVWMVWRDNLTNFVPMLFQGQ